MTQRRPVRYAAAVSPSLFPCRRREERCRVLTEDHKKALRHSWRLLEPLGETVSDLFYRRLFELRPDLRILFPPDMAAQKRKLLVMLMFIVKSMDWPIED